MIAGSLLSDTHGEEHELGAVGGRRLDGRTRVRDVASLVRSHGDLAHGHLELVHGMEVWNPQQGQIKPRSNSKVKTEGIRSRASPWREAGSGARGREGSAPPPGGRRRRGRRPWRRCGGVGGERRRGELGWRSTSGSGAGRGARRQWMWLRQRLSSHAGCGGGGVAVERDAEEACAATATGRGCCWACGWARYVSETCLQAFGDAGLRSAY